MNAELAALARSKLTRVLGQDQSRVEYAAALAAAGLSDIATLDDLARFAEALQRREGFVATVGALLSVEATMRRLA